MSKQSKKRNVSMHSLEWEFINEDERNPINKDQIVHYSSIQYHQSITNGSEVKRDTEYVNDEKKVNNIKTFQQKYGSITCESTPCARSDAADQTGSFFSLKQPLTYSEQIIRLQEKGLQFNQPLTRSAEQLLSEINYYRMSGFWLTFLEKDGEHFRKSTTMDDVLKVIQFDSELRLLILKNIEPIEIKMRANIAYQNLKEKYPSVNFYPLGFPDNWQIILERKIKA